ncbi:MAG: hypothetical protein WCO78_02590 [Candidatus Roizmanbacteria bacterium]
MHRRYIPYAFLIALALLLLVVISVRYGSYIQKNTEVNEYLFKLQSRLALTPSPGLQIPALKRVIDQPCQVSYLIPKTSDPLVQIACSDSTASDEAELTALGYEKTSLGTRDIFVKVARPYRELVLESITSY